MQPSADHVAQAHGSCGHRFLREIRRLKPINFWQEVKCIFRLAVPMFLSQLMTALLSIVSSAFCGHLGKVELGAVSLATTVISIAGISIGMGLSAACDTLISQTFGSKNLKRIGVILQRGILILSIACFPCWAILINIEHILLAFKLPPEVVKLTQLYVQLFCAGLPVTFLYELETRYLQNQGITMPQVVTGVIANIINAIINYLFLYVLALGVEGSAAANVISRYVQATLLFGYIRWKKLHVNTWAGWSTDCLQEWGRFTRLAIPSLLMLCAEWWAYDSGMLYVGLIDEVQLGVQGILTQILTLTYRISLGFDFVSAFLVGNALGAGKPEQAVNSAKVALYCIGCISFINGVILVSVKDVVGYIFTNNKDIVQSISEAIPICAAYQWIVSLLAVFQGVLRGTGKQKLGAIVNLVGCYLIGLPIGISLMFAAKLGAFVFFLIVIFRIDWNEASDQAACIHCPEEFVPYAPENPAYDDEAPAYDFDLIYTPGKHLTVADTLSRATGIKTGTSG
ncbi:multidrug and toxin extrusion protein 1-like [Scyliorhinus torazame]|uniref:multidrug and toxin extrusion protein 1-like n=1 Tax=Scyliorhinus torazame TaxID=75743 RepID=UPI003B5BB997